MSGGRSRRGRLRSRRQGAALVVFLAAAIPLLLTGTQVGAADWPQWGAGPEHVSVNPGETVLDQSSVDLLEEAWTHSFPGVAPSIGVPVVASGRVFVGVNDFRPPLFPQSPAPPTLYALDAVSGDPSWSRPLAGLATTPAAVGGRVFVSTTKLPPAFPGETRVYGFDAVAGTQLWSVPLPETASPVTVGADGLVYVTGAQTLYALRPDDGGEVWSAPLSPQAVGGAAAFAPAVSDGVVYVSWRTDQPHGLVSHVTAIDAVTHARLWDRTGVGGGAVVAVGSWVYAAGPGLDALDGATGGTRWHVVTNGDARPPAVDLERGLVILATQSNLVEARSTITGEIEWSASTGLGATAIAPPAIAGGVVYVTGAGVGGSPAKVVALDEDFGGVLWDDAAAGPGAVVADGFLYTGMNGLRAYSVQPFSVDLSLATTKSAGFAGNFVYTLDVHASGFAAHDVSLTDTIPAGTTLVSARASQGSCPAGLAPHAPTLTAATPGVFGISLQWDAPPGRPVTGYRVFRKDESGTQTLLATIGAVASYVDTTAPAGRGFSYSVSAVNAYGESPRSDEIAAPRPVLLPQQSITVASPPEAVAIGDVTGDGRADVVLTTTYAAKPATDLRVFVFAQTAGGALADPISYATAATDVHEPTSVAVGDITGDGKADVVVGISGTGVQLFPQLPAGTLGSPVLTPTPNSKHIRLGLLNDDALLDVAGVGSGTDSFSVLPNNGAGGLGAAEPHLVPHGAFEDIEVRDVTGNGRADAVISSWAAGAAKVSVVPQFAGGQFGSAVDYPVADGNGVVAGDVTGDGRNDVVVTGFDVLSVFRQTQAGALAGPDLYPTSGGPTPVEVGDMNLDGRLDVVTLGFLLAGVHVQTPEGTLAPETTYPTPMFDDASPSGLALGDVNGDGTPDVAAADRGGRLVVLRNAGPSAPPGSTTPGAPALASATATAGGVALSWAAPASNGGAPAVGYRIYRGAPGGTKSLLTVVGPAAVSFVDTSAPGAGALGYEVSAVNPVGEGPRSVERSATVSLETTVTCSLGQVAGDAFVTVEVHATAPQTFTNHAVVSSANDSTPGNNVSDLTHTDAPPDVGARSLAFTSGRSGEVDVYEWNATGIGPVNASRNPDLDWGPDWSPDGTKVAYDSIAGGNDDVYVMNRDGTGVKRLTASAATDRSPSWSADGRFIVFESNRDAGRTQIYRMRGDGSGITQLTESGKDSFPSYSPDGSKIAFISTRNGNGEVYVMNADGSGETRLTTTPDYEDLAPAWSPDGTKLAFSTRRTGDWEIFSMNADGSAQTNLTKTFSADDFEPAWSPDGTTIAFASDRVGGTAQIYLLALAGSTVTPVTAGEPGPNRDPAWSRNTALPLPPWAPTAVSATAGDGSATVSFGPPFSEGGAPPDYCTVTASPGGRAANGLGSPITVYGLTNGVTYTFTLTATNRVGTSSPSDASAPVTPEGEERPHPDPPPAASDREPPPDFAPPTTPRKKPPPRPH